MHLFLFSGSARATFSRLPTLVVRSLSPAVLQRRTLPDFYPPPVSLLPLVLVLPCRPCFLGRCAHSSVPTACFRVLSGTSVFPEIPFLSSGSHRSRPYRQTSANRPRPLYCGPIFYGPSSPFAYSLVPGCGPGMKGSSQ